MKKIVLFVLLFSIFCFVNLSGYTTVNSSSAHTLNMSIDIPEMRLTEREYRDGNTYSSIILPNAGKLMTGKPDVPGLANWILIPNGTSVSISTYPGEPLMFENVDLAPVQPEPSDNVDEPLPPFEKDNLVFSSDTNYPGIFAETESMKQKRGQSLTILWIYPYQYNPVKRTLTVYPDLEVSVNFHGVIKPIPSNLKNDQLIKFLKNTAINAEEVLQAEENAETIKSDRLERTDGCELLIITHPTFSSAANTLAAWKTRRGIYTTVVSTSTTGTTTTSIENYIDNAYDTWTPTPEYLLFIGDAEYIPIWYKTLHPSGGSQGHIGTDFFYADYDDPTDYVADFGYGRLSVDTAAEADSLVARIIRYERSPTTNSSYYTGILNATCFQDGAGSAGIDSVADRRFCKTSEDMRNYLHDQQSYPWSQREYVAYNRVGSAEIFPRWWNDTNQAYTFIFENDNPPNGGVEIPTYMQKPTSGGFDWNGSTAGISSAFNNGVFFALFRAHGIRSGWDDPDFASANVDALTNGEDRPFVWSVTCQSGWFDNETDDAVSGTSFTSECFVEHWIRHNTGGSCGVFAATRNSRSGYNDRLIWGMMDSIWPGFTTWCLDPYGGASSIYRMGDVINYGKAYMFTKYSAGSFRDDTTELYHWFGDPTTQMWTSEPSQLTNAYATTDVVIGTSSMTVRVEPAVSGMLVCAYTDNADEIFATATTNASGYAYLTFNNPLTIEPMVYVTVTKHNYLPYEFTADGVNTWNGSYNRFWSQPLNWSLNHVPTAGEDVIIPDVALTDPMYIDYEDAVCNDLTIASGVELQVEDQTLVVNADLSVSGHINLLEDTATITVMGDVVWDSGSFLTTTVNATYINVYGDWNFENGANVNPTQGYIDFKGSSDSWIRCYSDNSSFYRLRNYKSGGAKARVSNLCTEDLVINGLTYTTSSSIFESMSSHDIIMRGDFNYLGAFDFTQNSNTGSVIFDGDIQSTNNYNSGSGVFNNVIFSSSTSATLINEGITVMGDLTINQGVFNPADYTVTVGGEWTNTVGTAGFTEGTGRVVFDGANSAALLSPETFYDLHLDKTYSGFAGLETGFGDNNGVDVTVLHNLELFDGTMELNNPTNLVIGNNIVISVGATLNANDSGIINISVVEDWFDNNTSGGFDAGTASVVTFNGTSSTALHLVAENSYFNDIVIDSGSAYVRPSSNGPVIYCKNMDIVAGKLKVSSYRVVVDEALTISGMLEMSSPDDSLFVGDITWETGSSSIVADGKIFVSGNWTNSGGTFNPGTSMIEFDSSGDPQDVYGTNTFYDVHQVNNAEYLRFNGNTTILNNLELHYFCWAYDTFQVNGTLNINDAISRFTSNGSLAIVTIANLNQGGTLMCNGTATLTINDLVEDGIYGKYYVNDPGGTLNLTSSGWVDLNGELHITGGTMNVSGLDSIWPYTHDAVIVMNDGVLDFTNCSIYIYDSPTYSLTETITGGTIRTVGNFAGNRTDFNPTGGTIELYGTTDANINHVAGCNFYDVLINKAASDKITRESKKGKRISYNRDESVVEITRSEIVNVASNLDINGDLVINTGTLNSSNYTISVNDNVNINSGSILSMQPNGTLELDNGSALNVNSGGELQVIGTVGNLATITHRNSGNYAFNVKLDGTISAEYGLFEYMTDNGVYVWVGGIVDPIHSFNYCTFQNGYVGPGKLLYVENDEDLTITGANFPDNSSTLYNVAKILDHGSITMVGSTGIFAGEDYEHDPNTLIHWGVLPPIDDLTIQYNAGTDEIELNWTYPVPVDQFKIYRSTDPYEFSGAEIFISTNEWYSETATGTKYFYRVTAENISDNNVIGNLKM